MKAKKTVVVGIIAIALCGMIAFATQNLVLSEFQTTQAAKKATEIKILYDVSSKLGVTPNWSEIGRYIQCQATRLGRDRQSVEIDLEKVGAFSSRESPGSNRVLYNFNSKDLVWNIYGVAVSYDQEQKVMTSTLKIATGPSIDGVVDMHYDCAQP